MAMNENQQIIIKKKDLTENSKKVKKRFDTKT